MNYSVTIIIPVYNISNYIERCLVSVIRQSYKHIECIIVDDASQDDSLIKCEKIISTYNGPIKFSLQHYSKNRGLSAARNTGTILATGDYIYYLDGDDELTPTCIETLITPILEDNRIEMVQGNYKRCSSSGETISFKSYSSRSVMSNDDAHKQYFKHRTIFISAWNKLLRRAFVLEHQLFFKEDVIYEDYIWSFNLIKYLQIARVLNEITYYYVERPDSIVKGTNIIDKGKYFAYIYNDIFQNLTPLHEKSELDFYVEGFCRRFVTYNSYNIVFNDLIRTYQDKAKEFGCWVVYMKLIVTYYLSRFKYGLRFLTLLRDARNIIFTKG